MGIAFSHAIPDCSTNGVAADILFRATDRLCYTDCPAVKFFLNVCLSSCLPCHYSCNTCSLPYVATSCLNCNTTADRFFAENTNTCKCPFGSLDVAPIELCQDQGGTGCTSTISEDTAFKCLSCSKGFDLDYKLNRCVNSVVNCALLNKVTQKCAVCVKPQVLVAGLCIPPPANCEKANEVTGLCDVCSGDLIVSNGQCIVDPSCKEGLYRDRNDICQPEPF